MNEEKKKEDDLPHRDQDEIDSEARKSRRALDEVKEHGSDPLNEGP